MSKRQKKAGSSNMNVNQVTGGGNSSENENRGAQRRQPGQGMQQCQQYQGESTGQNQYNGFQANSGGGGPINGECKWRAT